MTTVGRRQLAAPVALGLLSIMNIAGCFVDGAMWERILSGLLAGALFASVIGLLSEYYWAWWVGVVSLLLQAGWGVQWATFDQEPGPTAFALGVVLLLSGSALLLLGALSMHGPPALPRRLVSLLGSGVAIAGVVSIAFEFEGGVIPGTLAAILGLSALTAWRRRRRRLGTERADGTDACAS